MIRVCFTCYREMGEDGRKRYERAAARAKIGRARKVIGLVTLVLLILGASAWFFCKPLRGQIAEQRLWAGQGWTGK